MRSANVHWKIQSYFYIFYPLRILKDKEAQCSILGKGFFHKFFFVVKFNLQVNWQLLKWWLKSSCDLSSVSPRKPQIQTHETKANSY